jgi:hypothetical protein
MENYRSSNRARQKVIRLATQELIEPDENPARFIFNALAAS